MIDIIRANKYCAENIALIENYDKAKNDTTQTWHIHHRLETDCNLSAAELNEMGLYFDRPANELIFLTSSEHKSLHQLGERNINYGKQVSDDKKDKVRTTWKEKYENGYVNPRTGKSPFEYFTSEEIEEWKVEHSKRMKKIFNDNPQIGEKISQKLTGLIRTEEQKQHYRDSFTDERREEISKRTTENNKKHKGENSYIYGRKWINNGTEEKIIVKDQIDLYLNKGYKLGRL